MKVLYLASEYLPYNNTGTFRTVKFIKALTDKGIQVKVITLEEEAADEFVGASKVDSTLGSIDSVPVERIIPSALFRYLFSFKSYITGIRDSSFPGFIRKIDESIIGFQPDIIIATHPHSATIRLAEYISTRSGIRLVVDMRDTWSYWPMASFRTRLHHYLLKKEEKRIFKNAALIITVTPEVGEIFIKTHGEWIRNKIRIIYNGFEGNLDVVGKIETKVIPLEGSIKIGYIGSFYYDPAIRKKRFKKWYQRKGLEKLAYFSGNEDWLYRSPYFFLKMLKLLIDQKPALSDKIKVEFIGKKQQWLDEMVKAIGVHNLCTQVGFLNKAQLNKKYNDLDYLLATSEKVINGRSYCLPSKLFDYIKLGKPILGVVTEGVQRTFLTNTGISFLLDPDDIPGGAQNLHKILQKTHSLDLNKTYLMGFSLENTGNELAEELVTLLD